TGMLVLPWALPPLGEAQLASPERWSCCQTRVSPIRIVFDKPSVTSSIRLPPLATPLRLNIPLSPLELRLSLGSCPASSLTVYPHSGLSQYWRNGAKSQGAAVHCGPRLP